MELPIQTAPLVASPSYPNSLAWSMENLVAIASGHIVTILNPASPVHPRGLITLPTHKSFPIGMVKGKDFRKACLLPACLSREDRSCARSISWSPLGFAPNSGSLLAVCTTEGRVILYRAPFCEDCSEWIEVMDVSKMLFEYLESKNFLEPTVPLELVECNESRSMEGMDAKGVARRKSASYRASRKRVSSRQEEGSTVLNGAGNCITPQISAEQYASRTTMLSSLVVAWSPVLYQCSNIHSTVTNTCTLLAVGGKSGCVSLLKMYEPQCYTVEDSQVSVDATVVGLLHAHSSWVTAISWVSYSVGSFVHLMLATGSSDGSVRIWLKDVAELFKDSEINASFLLRELTPVTLVPISTISLALRDEHCDTLLLAIGKGSGSLETWIYDIHSMQFQCAGIFNAHDQVVTGLAWAFGGSCFYSCSQDNSIRCWTLDGETFCESHFPCKIPGLKNSNKRLLLSDPCFGLALSPGGLMLVVAHSFDPNLLNQMYQARTQKAAVKFFCIGGQTLATMPDKNLEHITEETSSASESDLLSWKYNILWSLKSYEDANKPIVLWDVIAALREFKKSMPGFVFNILETWITCMMGFQYRLPIEMALLDASSWLPKTSSRNIHLLNILCRRVLLIEANRGSLLGEPGELVKSESIKQPQWKDLLSRGERELRERLVAFSFRAVLDQKRASGAPTHPGWSPVGVAQKCQWVAIDQDLAHKELEYFSSQLRELNASEQERMESCRFCSASVKFESPEVAFCGSDPSHRLVRCAASMQLCPVAVPSWFCMCCQRSVSKPAPLSASFSLLASPVSPLDSGHGEIGRTSTAAAMPVKPFCPFCGILLQRLLPDFLLSPSPV